MEDYYIIAFDSTHHAISTEQFLRDGGKDIMMIPTPREISSSCGLSIRIKGKDIDETAEQLKNKNMSYHGIFRVELEQGQKKFTKV